MDTFYKERANGRWNYWTYSEGLRVPLNSKWAERQIANKTARLIVIK